MRRLFPRSQESKLAGESKDGWVIPLILFLTSTTCFAAPPMREAPATDAVAANQLLVSGNACGPAAMLNAFRFGASHWRRVADAVKGGNDRERILTIIREPGMRPSKHLPGRARWSRNGVGVSDLRDMGNEMIMGHALPQLTEEVFFLKPRETPEKLLRRVHLHFDTSLAKGFPPVVSLRRHVSRAAPGKPAQWVVTDAHFVTLTAVQRRLDKHPRSFAVRYIDPWGGRHGEGVIRIPDTAVLADANGSSTCLEAVFPGMYVGRGRVRSGDKGARSGDKGVLVIAAGIGRW
jgi:hypothetical protein